MNIFFIAAQNCDVIYPLQMEIIISVSTDTLFFIVSCKIKFNLCVSFSKFIFHVIILYYVIYYL